MKHTLWLVAGAGVIAGSLVLGITAFAQTAPAVGVNANVGVHVGFTGPGSNGGARIPGVFGTVSAESGDTLTVTSRGFAGGFRGPGHNATSTGATTTGAVTVYTVDASNATVTKDNATTTLSAVNVGDTVMVQGTISGMNVVATAIRDGVVPMQMGRGGMHGNSTGTMMMHGSGSAPLDVIQGNGQPVVGGSVTAISNNTLTVTTAKDNVVYTIDASNATIEKGNGTSTIGNIAVGDNVLVQGSVSGTSVTASSVLDQGAPRTATSTTGTSGSAGGGKGFGGFVSAIGGLFHHIFGFF